MKQGWEKRSFGEVLDVLRNGVNCKQDKKGIGDKISRIESISSGEFDAERVGYTSLKEEEKEKYKLEYGDILFSHINSPIHVGKTAIIKGDDKIYHGVNLLLMRPKQIIDNAYLEHFLKYLYQNGYWKRLCKQSVNQASVNQQDIKKVEITFPESLPEQQRIASILDRCFEAIDRARAIAEQNLKNARKLFESYLQGVFEGRSGEWEERRFEDLIQMNQIGLIRSSKEQGIDKPYRYLKMDSISPDNSLINDKYVFVEASRTELEKFTLKKGDFLFNTRNSYDLVGKSCVFNPIDDQPTLFNNNIMRIVFKNGYSSRFINYAFSSTLVRERLKKLKSGTTSVVGIYYKGLRNLKVPVTTLNRQKEIVSKLDLIRVESNNLKVIYQMKIIELEKLKKSILQKAFAGEL